MGSNKGGFWKEFLKSKYGGWRSLKEGGENNKDSLWWRNLKPISKLEDWGRSFEDRFVWEVRRTSGWVMNP